MIMCLAFSYANRMPLYGGTAALTALTINFLSSHSVLLNFTGPSSPLSASQRKEPEAWGVGLYLLYLVFYTSD